jgi:hypothetical protein
MRHCWAVPIPWNRSTDTLLICDKNDQQSPVGCQIPLELVAVGTAATLRAQNADAPRKRTDRRSLQVSSPDFGMCRGRNSELVRTLTPALLSAPATILNVKSGGRPDGNRIAEERDRRRWRYGVVAWPLCLFYETRKEAHLPGEQENRCGNPVDEETRFSSLESSSSLERLNQLYGRRGH